MIVHVFCQENNETGSCEGVHPQGSHAFCQKQNEKGKVQGGQPKAGLDEASSQPWFFSKTQDSHGPWIGTDRATCLDYQVLQK